MDILRLLTIYPKTILKRINKQPGCVLIYDVPTSGGGTREIGIRNDSNGHFYGPGNPQNRGPHFNDPNGGHYDY